MAGSEFCIFHFFLSGIPQNHVKCIKKDKGYIFGHNFGHNFGLFDVFIHIFGASPGGKKIN